MARRNSSSLVSRRLGPKQDVVRIYKTEEVASRKSTGSIHSCVTNTSDTGTYEIEICEKQSLDCAFISTKALSSKISIGSVNSDYPCICAESQQVQDQFKSRVELADKDTNTVIDTVDRGQSCTDSKSVSSNSSVANGEDKCKSPGKTDSENSSCSSCNSTTSTCESTKTDNSSEESGSRCPNKNIPSNSPRSDDSHASCDNAKNRNLQKNDKIPQDSLAGKHSDKDVQKGKTTVVLELIREEEEEEEKKKQHSLKTALASETCNCAIKNYDERLKKLENLHFSSRITKNGENNVNAVEESEPESHHRSCDCTNILNFAEINFRIDALEKLYKDSLEKPDRKGESLLTPENLDETTRAAVEIAKIKKRLVDLEVKIMNRKIHHDQDVQSFENVSSNRDRKLAFNTTKNYLTQLVNKLSDKEIQVIDFENDSRRNLRTEDDWRIENGAKMTVLSLATETDQWKKIRLKNEAIQTPSRKEIDDLSADNEVNVAKRKLKSKKSWDRIHLCKDCGYYVTEKLRPVPNKSEAKSTENVQEENEKYGKGNISEIKKSFAIYPFNTPDYLPSEELRKSYLHQGRRLSKMRPKRNRKKFKLCTKCPMMNLKENISSNRVTDVGYGEVCPSLIFNEGLDQKFDRCCVGYKDLRKNERTTRLPQQSFQIYHSREMRRSLLLQPPSNSRLIRYASNHLSGVKDSPSKIMLNVYPLSATEDNKTKMLNECRHNHFLRPENFEKNISYSVTVAGPNDSRTPHSGFIKKNSLNPFRYINPNRKMKIPVLFEEICNSSENQTLPQTSRMSANTLNVAAEDGKYGLNPWIKILRKLSHSHSMENKSNLTSFAVSSYHCKSTSKVKQEKSKDKDKSFNLSSLFKKPWV